MEKRRRTLKKLGQLILTAMIGIIFIPAIITSLLGNNKPLETYTPMTENEKESIEEEKQSLAQLIAIVAKDIPVSYEKEALKAQVIIARSYIVTADHESIASMSEEDMKRIWGKDYSKNYSKMKEAVEETKNMIMTYENQPIQPVYHLQNPGITQTALDIWGMDIPYLESVESSWDLAGPDLTGEKKYSPEEVADKVNKAYKTPILEPYSLETQIQIVERTQGGYVKTIQVGSELMSGEDFRKILDLKSACFGIQYNNEVIFITKGIGHGVGLSQYGANQMAKEGKDAKAILKHYFPKVKIEQQ